MLQTLRLSPSENSKKGKYTSTQSSQAQIRRTTDQNRKIHLGNSGCIFFLLKFILGNTLTFANGKQLAYITDLVGGLAGKANTSHNHSISDVTNLQNQLDLKANKTDIPDNISSILAGFPFEIEWTTLDDHSVYDYSDYKYTIKTFDVSEYSILIGITHNFNASITSNSSRMGSVAFGYGTNGEDSGGWERYGLNGIYLYAPKDETDQFSCTVPHIGIALRGTGESYLSTNTSNVNGPPSLHVLGHANANGEMQFSATNFGLNIESVDYNAESFSLYFISSLYGGKIII